jgi:saccharopine dehydrogenase-like NADP-dependent oxidoreductase
LKDLGFFSSKPLLFDGHKLSARQVSAHLLERGLTLPGDDAVLMRIVAQGREQSVIYEGDIRADTSRGLSAMMRTTALPAAICARFLGNGTITARGGLRQEVDVPAERLLEELAGRGVILNKTSQRVYAANAPNRLC